MLVKSVRISPVRQEYGSWSSVFRWPSSEPVADSVEKGAAQTGAKLEIPPTLRVQEPAPQVQKEE
jgi:hypothetical protein